MDQACGALQRCVSTVTAQLDSGEYDLKLASHLAWITKQLGAIMGEVRKLEAHDEKMGKGMSPEKRFSTVMAYLKALPPNQQAAALDALNANRSKGSVLG